MISALIINRIGHLLCCANQLLGVFVLAHILVQRIQTRDGFFALHVMNYKNHHHLADIAPLSFSPPLFLQTHRSVLAADSCVFDSFLSVSQVSEFRYFEEMIWYTPCSPFSMHRCSGRPSPQASGVSPYTDSLFGIIKSSVWEPLWSTTLTPLKHNSRHRGKTVGTVMFSSSPNCKGVARHPRQAALQSYTVCDVVSW